MGREELCAMRMTMQLKCIHMNEVIEDWMNYVRNSAYFCRISILHPVRDESAETPTLYNAKHTSYCGLETTGGLLGGFSRCM